MKSLYLNGFMVTPLLLWRLKNSLCQNELFWTTDSSGQSCCTSRCVFSAGCHHDRWIKRLMLVQQWAHLSSPGAHLVVLLWQMWMPVFGSSCSFVICFGLCDQSLELFTDLQETIERHQFPFFFWELLDLLFSSWPGAHPFCRNQIYHTTFTIKCNFCPGIMKWQCQKFYFNNR